MNHFSVLDLLHLSLFRRVTPTKPCHIDRLPAEVLESISFLACTDSGSTGCTLACVSKRMRATTRAGRFTTVSLSSRNAQQLASFLACFIAERGRTAAGYSAPKVRYLFLASAKRTLKNDHPESDAELQSYQENVSSLIKLVVADLYCLLVFHENGIDEDELHLPGIGLARYPLLERLSLFGRGLEFPPAPSPGQEDDGDSTEDIAPFPSLPRLTHLQLTRTSDLTLSIRLNCWARAAPNLTHLFLCNIDYGDRFPLVRQHLRDIVNLNGPDSLADFQVLIVQPTAAPGLIRGAGTPRKAYCCFAESLADLHENGMRRWALLPVVKRSTGRKEFEKAARKEWIAWQQPDRRPDCWSVDESYFNR